MELINSSIIIVVFQNFAKVKGFYCQTKQPRQNHLHCGQICKLPMLMPADWADTCGPVDTADWADTYKLGRYLQTCQIPTDLVDTYRLGRFLQTWKIPTDLVPTDLVDTYRPDRYLQTWKIPTDLVDTYRPGRYLQTGQNVKLFDAKRYIAIMFPK